MAMTEREALKLALEALNATESDCGGRAFEREQEAITAIKEALAQPEQEPVKFEAVWDSGPTNKDYEDAMRLKRLQQLTAPPQRKPLTDEEIRDLWSWSATAEAERTATTQQHAFARAIEAAHGIKGGARAND